MNTEKKLYMLIYRVIVNDIYNGKYLYNSKLPNLSQLCAQYNVGRNTMRSALLQLSQDGFVALQKGVKATVIFDFDNPEHLFKYKQDMIDRKQMLKDAYETMELILPDTVTRCLAQATPEQIVVLNDMVNRFSTEYIQNGHDLIEQLYNIYLYAFSFLNNPLLNDIFITIMYSVNPPVMGVDGSYLLLQRSLKLLKTMMKTILKFAGKNDFVVKKMISAMCKGSSKQGIEYIDKICDGMTVKKEREFIWVSNRSQEYLYLKVIGDILKKIYYQDYMKGMKLPSISKLALEYDVSEKTIRKMLDVLRKYEVIETKNGIGSIIIIDNFYNSKKYLENQEMRLYIDEYFYSLELLSMIMSIITPTLLKNAKINDLCKIKENIESQKVFSIECFIDYIFSQCNQCLRTIYEELKKSMNWSVFVNHMVHIESEEVIQLKINFCNALMKKDIPVICTLTQEIFKLSLDVKENISTL